MKTNYSVRTTGILTMLLLLFVGSACNRGSGPPVRLSTPPTFVLGWRDANTQVRTRESRDAAPQWFNGVTHANSNTDLSPAVAHDGGVNFMLMWATSGGFLHYKVGVGGVPAPPALPNTGATWESGTSTIDQRLPAGGGAYQVAGSPTLAFGNGRWVVVFRTATNGLQVIRSQPNSATSWETVATVAGASSVNGRDPALAFGNNLFVLLFQRSSGMVVATTSADGLTWSLPTDVIATPFRDPGLTFANNAFFAVLSREVSGPITTHHFTVHKSADGVTWSSPIGEGGNWDMNVTEGPGVAYGQCQMVVVFRRTAASQDISSWIGTPPQAECASPNSLNFGNEQVTNVSTATLRPGLAFGQTHP
jgi:hypothetical protein